MEGNDDPILFTTIRKWHVLDMGWKNHELAVPRISLQVYSECCASGVRRIVGVTLYRAFNGNCGNQSSRC